MREQKFEKVLGDLENTKISLFLSDHQWIEGVLLAVKQDHLVIDVNNNVHYIPNQHIKAFSKNTKDFHVTPKKVPYLDRQHFTEILNVLKYCSITLNSSSEQSHFGVLSQIAEDHIVLINHDELLYIPKSSIANIHSQISDNQIRLINDKEPLTSQTMHSATFIEELEEMEIHQLESAQDAILPTDYETESVDLSVKKQIDTIQEEEEKEKLQTDKYEGLGYLEILQQLKVAGGLDLSNMIDKKNQGEEQVVETHDLESIGTEESLEEIKTDLQEELSSDFKDFRVELLSFDEPLGYERSFLLPDWKTYQKDRQAMTTGNNQAEEEEETPTLDDHSEQINDNPEPIELGDILKSVHQPTNESKYDDQAELISEEYPSDERTRVKITFRQMSPQEEKEMLEKQYFSLAKYAAAYSMKLDECSGESKSTLLSSIDHNMNRREEQHTRFEALERKNGHEGQYVSLMNHAAKMYRQLRDF